MKQPTEAKGVWAFLQSKKFYVPFLLAIAVVLGWLGIVLWKRWKVAALIIGILIMILSGCRGVRLFKAS